MSAAATNARTTVMPPPANNLKRKTLVDRAGETSRPAPAPPTSRPVNSSIKAVSIAGAPRETSFSSSVSSSRPAPGFAARSALNSSHSSSLGSGSRLPSAQSCRPQSSMAYSRIQRPSNNQVRPATSLEVHQEEPAQPRTRGKTKRRVLFSSCLQGPSYELQLPRLRGRPDIRPNCNLKIDVFPETPDYSLGTQLNALTLDGGDPSTSTKLKAFDMGDYVWKPVPKADAEHSVPMADDFPPQNPSHIPKLVAPVALPSESPSPIKTSRKTHKKPCQLPMFLSRDTNTKIAWDTDSRLDELENQHARFKEEIGRATSQSNSLQEMVQVYKLRSKPTTIFRNIYSQINMRSRRTGDDSNTIDCQQ